jgi:hypothetical protein
LEQQLLSEITARRTAKLSADSLTGKDAVTYANEKIKTLIKFHVFCHLFMKVLPSVDLEYVVQSNQVKENLILQIPTDHLNIQLQLESEKSNVPVLQKDGSIWFVDLSQG